MKEVLKLQGLIAARDGAAAAAAGRRRRARRAARLAALAGLLHATSSDRRVEFARRCEPRRLDLCRRNSGSDPKPSVDQMQRAVGARGEFRVVRDDDERGAAASALSSSMRSNTCAAVWRSRLPVGSSASTQRGCVTSARASATRWRSPPDSSPGRCSRRWPSPTRSSIAAAAARASRRRHAPDQQRHRDVLDRGELRQQVMELVDEAERAVAHLPARGLATATRTRRRRRSPRPRSGTSRPPSRCSSVLLPDPDAPTIATRSPGCTARSTPISTGTSRGPLV